MQMLCPLPGVGTEPKAGGPDVSELGSPDYVQGPAKVLT